MTSKISFTSNIKIVPNDEFEKQWKIHNPQNAQMKQKPIISSNSGTKHLACCIGIGLSNKKNASSVSHYPTKKDCPNVWIDETVKILEDNKEVKGLITGGYSGDCGLLKEFVKPLNSFGVYPSIVYGRKNGWKQMDAGTDFFYSLKEDTYFITTYPNHKINSISQLLKTFRTIEIQNNDKLFISNKEVNMKILNRLKNIEKIKRNIIKLFKLAT